LNPLKSARFRIGCVAEVIWRKPLSRIPLNDLISPRLSMSFLMIDPSSPSNAAWTSGDDLNANGTP
jgi:hypothetical protein